jgi:DNA-binding MarR family transcriptional regulator
MSIRIMTLAWQVETATHSEKLVLLALADNANDAGECWPSISTIAKKCSLSRQGVLNQISRLEASKLVCSSRGNGRVNRYTVTIQPVHAVDQSTPLTSQPDRLPPVHAVDGYQSTPLTTPVHAVDTNRQEPSFEPPLEPSVVAGSADAASAIAKKKTRKAQPITDEYLNELQAKYTWVNVHQEFTKALTWYESRNRVCSRQAFVNWINRAPVPPTAKAGRPNGLKPVALQRNYLEGLTPEQIGDF